MELDIQSLIIQKKEISERQAVYADFPEQMLPELSAYLKENGLVQLYCHQAEMFQRAMRGENLVITTSTASGKTLSFLLPVLHTILKDPTTRAIFLYPTKALAADQYRALLPYLEYFGKSRISAGVYDGDTPPEERSRIRKTANIILTNPEMLNGAFLPNHAKYGFDFIFSNLRFVVVDELHSYRGVFGSHVANVFRRLWRVCDYYGSQPQVLCSSATIANPLELAAEICQRSFYEICEDGSPAAKRNYYVVQPPRIENKKNDFVGQIQAATVAAEMVPDLVKEAHNFLIFCKSRRNVEIVLREARDKLDADSLLGHSQAEQISGYRGGYTPIERKTIERKMISGQLKGLVSTNALELGIDIGSIDTTVLVGFPGTRASFWQQTGRAGRSGADSHNYLILESLPVDQYVGINPMWLFANSSEHAVVDKNNLLIELAHIRAAAAELPITLDDIAIFPDLGESIPVLMRIEELRSQNGKFVWCGSAYPAGDYSLRNIDKNRYKLMDKESHHVITEMDELQAFREIHDGAIYMHDGKQYQVVNLDLEQKTAFAIPFEGNYYTMPGGSTEVRIIQEQESMEFGCTRILWGDVNVNDIVFMYKKLQFHNHQNLGYENLRKPLCKDYNSESLWIRMPETVVETYRKLLQEDASGQLVNNNHFDGLCHILGTAARMVTMTEREDIGVSMSANAIGMNQAETGEVFLFIYDKFAGGLGYAQKAYECMDQILDQAVELVRGCSCKDGCAVCTGDYKLSKSMVLWGLLSLREELKVPEYAKIVSYAQRPKLKKQFLFAELPQRWGEFCAYIKNRGEKLAGFLGTIPSVCVEQNTITLYTNQQFYKAWISEKENKKSLKNIFVFYTEAPSGLQVKVEVREPAEKRNLEEKLKQRYKEQEK